MKVPYGGAGRNSLNKLAFYTTCTYKPNQFNYKFQLYKIKNYLCIALVEVPIF